MYKKESDEERVLILPNEKVADFFSRAFFYPCDDRVDKIVHDIEWNANFLNRAIAESSKKVKQVIVYTIIRNERKILFLKRSKNSNRKSLRLKNTILFGGHINDLYDEPGNRLIKSLYRELSEELNIQPNCKPKLLGLVVDPTTDVGCRHLGVIFDTKIDSRKVFLLRKKDTSEFIGSDKNYSVELKEADFLLNEKKALPNIFNSFDNWSTLFLRSPLSNFLFGENPRRESTLLEYGIY